MKKVCFGIDIGGTSIKCGLFDDSGQVLDKWELNTRTEDKGKNIIPDVATAITEKMAEKGLSKADIIGVGVGIPGPVDEAGNVLEAVNLYWDFVPLAKELEDTLKMPVKVGNDANVAALGEMWQGGGRGYQNVVMVTLGTGVGGGIIIGGKMISGTNGAAGEIGHVHVVDTIDEICNCGNKGCLEQVTSATGIVYLANKHLAKSEQESCLRGSEVSAKAVFDAVKAGDVLAMEVAEQFGNYLGNALKTIAVVVDPEVFVIGGGVSKAGEILLDYTEKHYRDNIFSACKDTKFSLAELGNDAGIYGAAKLVLS